MDVVPVPVNAVFDELTSAVAFTLMTLPGSDIMAQNGTWSTLAPMPTARREMAAGVVNGVFAHPPLPQACAAW